MISQQARRKERERKRERDRGSVATCDSDSASPRHAVIQLQQFLAGVTKGINAAVMFTPTSLPPSPFIFPLPPRLLYSISMVICVSRRAREG